MPRIHYVRVNLPAPEPAGGDPQRLIPRVVVEQRDDASAARDWESELAAPGVAAVRVSPTRPRIADIYPTLPMRFFEVDGNGEIRGALDGVTPYLVTSGTAASLAAPIPA